MIVVLLLLCVTNAHAYLDPGTGSILLQGLLAGVVGFLGVVKIYWRKILAWFKRNPQQKNEKNDNKHDPR